MVAASDHEQCRHTIRICPDKVILWNNGGDPHTVTPLGTHPVEPVTLDFNTGDVQHKHSRAIKMSRVQLLMRNNKKVTGQVKVRNVAVPAYPGVVLGLYIYISKDEFTLCKVVKPHWHLRNSSISHRCHTQLTDISNSPLSIGRPS